MVAGTMAYHYEGVYSALKPLYRMLVAVFPSMGGVAVLWAVGMVVADDISLEPEPKVWLDVLYVIWMLLGPLLVVLLVLYVLWLPDIVLAILFRHWAGTPRGEGVSSYLSWAYFIIKR